MSAFTVMARYLAEELQAHGLEGLSLSDCTEILRRVVDRTAELSDKTIGATEAAEPPRS
jgi:hypothetical protein